MEAAICITCGTQYPDGPTSPLHCPICEDDRQYVNAGGQQWTSLGEMRAKYHNVVDDVAEAITAIRTEPSFAIGQQAHLLCTPAGNVLWDCISLIDDASVERVKERGGLSAIAISHPHFYSSMVEWSRTFDAPILLHEDNRPWVMRPDRAVQYWTGGEHAVLPGVTIVRCGGHFPGSCVLHWSGPDGGGALFTGDTITVVRDRRYVSFMYSYPNLVPLNAAAIRQIVSAVEPYPFDRLYGGWAGDVVAPDAKEVVRRSAERYIAHIQGSRAGFDRDTCRGGARRRSKLSVTSGPALDQECRCCSLAARTRQPQRRLALLMARRDVRRAFPHLSCSLRLRQPME